MSGNLPSEMNAIRVRQFGGIDSLVFERVDVPIPGDGQVLVQVHVAGVGPWDAWVRSGQSALQQPLPLTPGSDISGVVVALGDAESGFAIGDAVFGVTNPMFTGGYAEYALAQASMIAPKPPALGFMQAAAIPVVAVTAWTMVQEMGEVDAGQRVLVNGGAGNVGAYAVQFAKRAGAHVTATALGADMNKVKALGADVVINFETTDFVTAVGAADLVIDTVGGDTQTASFAVLGRGGRLISSVSQPDIHRAQSMGVIARYFIVDVSRQRLEQIAALTPDLAIAIGDVLPLSEARLAHEMLAGLSHKPGKIMLAVAPANLP
ncbi:MAG: Bifunctional protein: zinc-containing alcohol dehydrogenase [Devosia sp.]|nr:Bifunctional protein: zinc-containing alcohol dehydrogenase [Devosia sp.]